MRAAVLMVSGAVDAVAVLMVFAIGDDSCAVLALHNVFLWQPLTLHISLDPEVGEEHEEEGSVHPDEVDDQGELVIAAGHEVILGGVKRYQDKLYLWGGIKLDIGKGYSHVNMSLGNRYSSPLINDIIKYAERVCTS